ALRRALGDPRLDAARVHPDAWRAIAVPAQEQRRAVRRGAQERQEALEAQARLPGGVGARLRPRDGVRGPAPAREGREGWAYRGGLVQERADALVAQAGEPQRV